MSLYKNGLKVSGHAPHWKGLNILKYLENGIYLPFRFLKLFALPDCRLLWVQGSLHVLLAPLKHNTAQFSVQTFNSNLRYK